MHQVALPVEVSPLEVMRKPTLGAALDLCLEVAGLEPKQVQGALKLDKAQFSRWQSGQEGVNWPKLVLVMDHCGNDAPLMWMNHQRHYDIGSMRKLENKLERENRLLREENAAFRRILTGSQA